MKNAKRRRIKRRRFQINKSAEGLLLLSILKSKPQKPRTLSGSIISDPLMSFLEEKGFSISSHESGKVEIKIPKKFSFIEDPDTTIMILRKLNFYANSSAVREIHIDHTGCEELDVCASGIMDVILVAARRKRKNIRRPLILSGTVPSSGRVKEVLDVSGILKTLGYNEPIYKHICKLPLQECLPSAEVSGRVADYYLECLSVTNLVLSAEGIALITSMVGEVVDNCILHAGNFKKWYTLGHYRQLEGKSYGQCKLMFFNFGNTIYEGLKAGMASPILQKSIDDLTERHTSLFSLLKGQWNQETLWTLYALQEGVSRLRDETSEANYNRGTGTMIMIDSLMSIGATVDGKTPRMSITSGKTHILFDGKYKPQTAEFPNGNRKIIAFNQENDLYIPPDSKYVKRLKYSFPGTIISMKFYLDGQYIIDNKGGVQDENGFRSVHKEKEHKSSVRA